MSGICARSHQSLMGPERERVEGKTNAPYTAHTHDDRRARASSSKQSGQHPVRFLGTRRTEESTDC